MPTPDKQSVEAPGATISEVATQPLPQDSVLRVQANRPAKDPIRIGWAVVFGLSLAGLCAQAEESPKTWRVGVQGGLTFPTSDDLRITTGMGLNPACGLNATWDIHEIHRIQLRLDLWTFTRGFQEVSVPQHQRIDTRVQSITLGGEYLLHPGGPEGQWAVGPGLYVIRWSVASINQLSGPLSGTAQATGTSSWFRGGLGVVASCRLSPHVDAEFRWISSNYGYEKVPAQLGTAGLLWRF